jgi:hypothetical protein
MLLVVIVATGCGALAGPISTLNQWGTQAAGGLPGVVDTPDGEATSGLTLPDLSQPGTPALTLTPQPATNDVQVYDITTSTTDSLVRVWASVYTLPAGTNFEVSATERQLGDHVIAYLQARNVGDAVQGGSAVVAGGQIRIDLALQDDAGGFGAGTVTFQPTLDAGGVVRLNPLGADFGTVLLPDDFTAAIGDAVYAGLTGTQQSDVNRVVPSRFTLQDGILHVEGALR